MNRLFFTIGSLMAGISVIAGAYGAHADGTLSPEQIIWIEKASRYQMYHALALIFAALAMSQWPNKTKMFCAAGGAFLLGIILFSGSLYIMALTDSNLGYMTPAGGFSFIAGWLIMGFAGASRELSS